MRWLVLGLTSALTAFATPAAAPAADCWVLKGAALEQARQRAQCQDAFALNPPKAAASKPTRKAKAKAARPRKAAPPKRVDFLDTLTAMLKTMPTARASGQRPSDHLTYGAPSGSRVQR
ncbi:MAG TPA: hypothetical protein VD978_37395 [Azospirillum sp.]|nr:hypothetical protein [Azospirillum sp.]